MSEADLKIARFMAQLTPEERLELQDYQQQRRLQQLQELRKIEKSDPKVKRQVLEEIASSSEQAQFHIAKLDNLNRQILGEAGYIEEDKRRQGDDVNFIENEAYLSKHGRLPQKLDLRTQQRFRASRKDEIVKEASQRVSGAWFRKY